MTIGKNLIPFSLREKILQKSNISYFNSYFKFINSAFTYLEKNNQIIGPSTDGGFYLIGSKSNLKKEVWENTEWSCAKTLQTFVRSLKPKPYKLKIFTDVDEFQDLSEMIKEMPSITSKRQVKLIKWVNSIEELIK